MLNSLTSDKLSPSLISLINRVMNKRSMIAVRTIPEGIGISELIDACTTAVLTFQLDASAKHNLQTSRSHAGRILYKKIH